MQTTPLRAGRPHRVPLGRSLSCPSLFAAVTIALRVIDSCKLHSPALGDEATRGWGPRLLAWEEKLGLFGGPFRGSLEEEVGRTGPAPGFAGSLLATATPGRSTRRILGVPEEHI